MCNTKIEGDCRVLTFPVTLPTPSKDPAPWVVRLYDVAGEIERECVKVRDPGISPCMSEVEIRDLWLGIVKDLPHAGHPKIFLAGERKVHLWLWKVLRWTFMSRDRDRDAEVGRVERRTTRACGRVKRRAYKPRRKPS